MSRYSIVFPQIKRNNGTLFPTLFHVRWLIRLILSGMLALAMVATTTIALASPTNRIMIPNDLTGSQDPPSAILDSANNLTVFVRKADHQVWYRAQGCPGCGYGVWNALGGLYAVGTPVAALDGNGVLHVFETGMISGYVQLYHTYTTCSGCAWNSWTALTSYSGNFDASISVGVNSDGRVEVFMVQVGGNVWHVWQTCSCSPTGFSGLSDFGLGHMWSADLIGVGQDLDGRLELFPTGANTTIMQNYEKSPGCCWNGWGSFGTGYFPSVSVGQNQDGRLEVFVENNSDSTVWHRWQTCPGCGWSGWASLGGFVGSRGDTKIGVGRNQDGHLELFILGSNNQVFHLWQKCANCPFISNWNDLGGSVQSNIAVGHDADGRLEIFATGTGFDLQSNYESSPNCCWHGWYSLGT